ncbi:unnamed protein product [Kluyveromyces dobzhanskii CBS 2104]|uniref:WGS project CCBQ000000000 data, contig 00058 n=1 Tax=Kluyveromyces dobzhanskii CBS 2104 TaxID=1427455 RepID=A0A0A8LDP5_9SACH|nr:unnamed protein product [Kluyveromyces dobzhanskii CBS 2104]
MSDSEVKDDSVTKETKERRKIEIKFIQDKTRRHITFSKRKHGIMKKAYELSVLTGTQVLLLVVSETGLVYTFTTPKFQPIVTQPEGKNLIQACLNAPEEDDEEEDDDDEEEEEDDEHNVQNDYSGNVGGQPHATVPTSVQLPAAGHAHGLQPQQQQQQRLAQQQQQGQNVQQQHQPQPGQHQQPQGQGAGQTPNFTNASYLNPDHAAAYEQYFNGVNSQHGQF